MIRIAISAADFDAIAATLPLGTVAFERKIDAKGDVHIWLEPGVVNMLRAIRGPGKGYSDVIIRLSAGGG